MAEQKAYRRYIDEAQETFGDFVVAGGHPAGFFRFVEAPLDEVAQPVEGAIHGNARLAGLAHRDHRHDVARE